MITRAAALRVREADVLPGASLPPVTPGEILRDEFMVPLGLSARALARDLDVPANRISEIVGGTRGITADTAIRLADRLGCSAEFWLNLQTAHDLDVLRARNAKRETRVAESRQKA